MLLFRLRRSERLKVEAFVGTVLVALMLLFPLPWWLRIPTVASFAAIALHLSLAWPDALAAGARLRFGTALTATILIAAVVWLTSREQNSADRARNADEAASPLLRNESGSNADLKDGASLIISGFASDNEKLRRETATAVIRLREFQKKIDAWYQDADVKLTQPTNKNLSPEAASRSNIDQAKKLASEMADLDREFNSELKGPILTIKERLETRMPAKSLPVNPSVDWVLQHGFANVHNGVGNIADYLETLAQRLPEK